MAAVMLTPDQILKQSNGERQNLRLAYGLRARKRRRKNTDQVQRTEHHVGVRRKCWDKKDVVEYIRKNNVRKIKELAALKDDETVPTVYMVTHYYGSWREAMHEIWGNEMWMSHVNAEYILKCVIEFKIWTVSEYVAARRKNPDIIPSMKVVLKYWGRFSNLIECASRMDLRTIIEDYCRFVIQRGGKIPSSDILQRHGLRIGEAVTLFGSKEKFDAFILDYIRGRAI